MSVKTILSEIHLLIIITNTNTQYSSYLTTTVRQSRTGRFLCGNAVRPCGQDGLCTHKFEHIRLKRKQQICINLNPWDWKSFSYCKQQLVPRHEYFFCNLFVDKFTCLQMRKVWSLRARQYVFLIFNVGFNVSGYELQLDEDLLYLQVYG